MKHADDILDDELDETMMERLWGLTEMFPDTVRKCSVSLAKKFYSFSRRALWVGTTSFMILVLPVVLVTWSLELEQQQLQQQRHVGVDVQQLREQTHLRILLGPNTGMSGGMPGMMPPAPGKM